MMMRSSKSIVEQKRGSNDIIRSPNETPLRRSKKDLGRQTSPRTSGMHHSSLKVLPQGRLESNNNDIPIED